MTEQEVARYRKLWASVALTALSEHRSRIQAAAQRRPSLYIGSNRAALGEHEDEIAAARIYVGSADFREVCDLAGVAPSASDALRYVKSATERFSMKLIREAAE